MRMSTAYATLTPVAGGLAFVTPYDQGLLAEFKRRIPPDARKWEPSAKHWIVAPQYGQVCADLADTYLGVALLVPQVVSKPTTETRLVQLDYLGRCKARDNGDSTAFGWADGGWTVIIPETVLREFFEAEPSKPGEAPTLFAVLMVKTDATIDQIRSAYRRLARQVHPDVNKEPDAAEQFKTVQHAYEILSDDLKRRKYSAGLALEAAAKSALHDLSPFAGSGYNRYGIQPDGYRPVLRCGWVLCEGIEQIGRFVVSKLLQWEDVVREDGKVMVTSWPMGADKFETVWR
jgi:hypothetical protein